MKKKKFQREKIVRMVLVKNNREQQQPTLVLLTHKGRVAVYDMTPALKPSAPAFTLRLSAAPVAIGSSNSAHQPLSSSNAPGTAAAAVRQAAYTTTTNNGPGQQQQQHQKVSNNKAHSSPAILSVAVMPMNGPALLLVGQYSTPSPAAA